MIARISHDRTRVHRATLSRTVAPRESPESETRPTGAVGAGDDRRTRGRDLRMHIELQGAHSNGLDVVSVLDRELERDVGSDVAASFEPLQHVVHLEEAVLERELHAQRLLVHDVTEHETVGVTDRMRCL